MSLKRIYHIADIHIRNVKRHKEFREVFLFYYFVLTALREENSN